MPRERVNRPGESQEANGGTKKRSSGVARSSDGLVNVAWVVLHCNRRIGARKRRLLIPHVRFQVPFLGPESQLKCAGLLCNTMSSTCKSVARLKGKPGGESLLNHTANKQTTLPVAG